MDKYNFRNCQKIVVFSSDNSKVLLAKRKGENDYDGVFSFIGGKMEVTDKNFVEGMRREKNEEIGESCKLQLNPIYNSMAYFITKAGDCMVLPHYYAKYIEGEIKINDEYSEYKWVDIKDLDAFEPKIENIEVYARRLLALIPLMKDDEFVEI